MLITSAIGISLGSLNIFLVGLAEFIFDAASFLTRKLSVYHSDIFFSLLILQSEPPTYSFQSPYLTLHSKECEYSNWLFHSSDFSGATEWKEKFYLERRQSS